MANNKLLARLRNLEGAVKNDYNPVDNCLRTPSPGVNWAMGIAGHGLPFGYTMVLYGPPKGGKSVICNSFIGQLHRDDPEAIAITFNTELRGELQSSQAAARSFGVDPERFICYDVNQPELIFDRIEKDISAMCDEGLKVKLIVIDSLKNILGRRFMGSDTVSQQQIGDQAATIQDGLMRIMSTIRKHKIALVLTTHIRAELDQKEQMRGKTVKMASAWAVKHLAEFFCFVEPNQSKTGRTDLAGEEFVTEEIKDFMDNAQKTGHKIRFKVEGNSIGPAGRVAEFTLDYTKGIVNQYEEIFYLAKNTGIITKPNNMSYEYNGEKWVGLKNCLIAIRDSVELQNKLLDDIYRKDLEVLGCILPTK